MDILLAVAIYDSPFSTHASGHKEEAWWIDMASDNINWR